MRIAVVADIHGNRTAFEAVLAYLRQTSPDLILHGDDLFDGGSSPVAIVDRIRDLGWRAVMGNTDEMLAAPESLEEFASQLPALQPLWTAIRKMASATREALGETRLASLALASAYGERGRTGVDLLAARPAAYVLLDESDPVIRRVEYDVDREVEALYASGTPHSDWVAKMLRSAASQMP